MKPTQRTDAIRNIRKKIISFLSIVLIVMLGVGGFFTTSFMNNGLRERGEGFYDQQHFKDFEIDASAGFTEEEIRDIETVPGVDMAEGVLNVTARLWAKGRQRDVLVVTNTERVSVPQLLQGRAPVEKNECMIQSTIAEDVGIGIGDRVRIRMADPSEGEDILAAEEFLVTGIMIHPDYLRTGMAEPVVVSHEGFDEDKTGGLDLAAYVRLQKEDGISMFSKAYEQHTSDVKQALETRAEQVQEEGTARLQDEANKRIDREEKRANKKLNKGKKKLEAADEDLAAGLAAARQKLKKGEEKLKKEEKAGEAQLQAGKKKLDRAWKKIKKGRGKIRKAEKDLNKAKKDLKRARKAMGDYTPDQIMEMLVEAQALRVAVEEAMASGDEELIRDTLAMAEEFVSQPEVQDMIEVLSVIQNEDAGQVFDDLARGKNLTRVKKKLDKYVEGMMMVSLGPQLIADNEKKLKKAKRTLAKKENKYFSGVEQYEKGKQTLEDKLREGRAQLAAGWKEYREEKADKEKELKKAWKEYKEKEAEARDKIESAREEAEGLEGHAIVQDRSCNAGYVDLRSNIVAVRSAGILFGIMFLILSAIVCFSTLTIIIEEQKRLVGTTKAFGFRNDEIMKKYLLFGVIAGLAGAGLGILLAAGLGTVALNAIEEANMYVISSFHVIVTPMSVVISAVSAVALCFVVTVFACRGLLRTPASMLMKGETQRRRREKAKASGGSRRKGADKGGRSLSSRLFGHQSLYSRLILRNMRQDISRVILTIAIIAGSCFIIGLAFTVRSSFEGMTEAQQDQILNYDCRTELTNAATDEEREAMEEYLDEKGIPWSAAAYEMHLYQAEDGVEAITVLCADPKDIHGIYNLLDPKTQEPIELPEEGILIQNRLHETAGLDAGDTMELYGGDLSVCQGKIAGQFQNYQGRLIIMSDDTYREVFGTRPKYNSIYMSASRAQEKEIREGLQQITPDLSFENRDSFLERFGGLVDVYNVVVAIMMWVAMLIAFVILLNLTNIFISRKKREIITMRVNGFSQKQTDGYLVRETVFVTLTGLALAIILGMTFTGVFVRGLEQPDVQFIRTPNFFYWGTAALIEALFAFVINLISFRQTRKFQLREIAES